MRGCMDEFVVSALAASGRREMLALDARHLEAGAAVAFLHNLVDARRLNFLARLVLLCHGFLRAFVHNVERAKIVPARLLPAEIAIEEGRGAGAVDEHRRDDCSEQDWQERPNAVVPGLFEGEQQVVERADATQAQPSS